MAICLRAEVTWFPLGPFGGDARSFAADPRDPRHIYLGTATGWVYDSTDGGTTWKRVAQIAHRNDLVIDHILADPNDPKRLIVGAWKVDHPDGGLWISEDGGANWYAQAEMHGQSIRALARSATDPRELVAGTLRGVFQSFDNGVHWKQISPEGSTEIHEVESIAIDPANPQIIYAGTWHLPWKTTDGGQHWESIKKGILEDSDVFSIIVDPAQPNTVYASACSGIYKSVNAAAEFTRIQGIPKTAIRTRKLAQDPRHPDTVYAGTTEGLYRTLDGGTHWARMTGPEPIVNDVYIDPDETDHVLIATDRGGVLASDNAGESFHASNAGFSARQIVAYAADPRNRSRLYVGVVNDKETGGVFESQDAGVSWQQQSSGLAGRDVFSLAVTEDGPVLAGTNHGILRKSGDAWTATGLVRVSNPAKAQGSPAKVQGAATKAAKSPAKSVTAERMKSKLAQARRTAAVPPKPNPAVKPEPKPEATEPLDVRVYALLTQGSAVYAGSSDGLLRGDVSGNRWAHVPALKLDEVRFIAAHGDMLLAAGLKELDVSGNDGVSWKAVPLPADLTQVSALAVDDSQTIWIGGREGLFRSADMGASWHPIADLQLSEVDSVYFDAPAKRLLVTTEQSNFVFAVSLPEFKVHYWNSGWKLRFARPVGDHLLAATLFDGIVVQPQMVDSAVAPVIEEHHVAAVASTTLGERGVKP